jgi:hypothetical protein
MVSTGLQQTLVSRLSQRASLEFPLVQEAIDNTVLLPSPDKRLSLFTKGDYGLDSGALYCLLKARDNLRMNELHSSRKILHRRECSSSCGCLFREGFYAARCYWRSAWSKIALARSVMKLRNHLSTSSMDANWDMTFGSNWTFPPCSL